MEVRSVRPAEHDLLGELTVAAYNGVHPAEDMVEYAAELRDVAGRAAGAEILVAVDGASDSRAAEVLGGVTYVPGPDSPSAEFTGADTAGIRMLAVAPGAQGRGVGQTLVLACIERARTAGKAKIRLHSTEQMTTAHRLYERLGFVRDPLHDWEPEPGFWLRAFRLDL